MKGWEFDHRGIPGSKHREVIKRRYGCITFDGGEATHFSQVDEWLFTPTSTDKTALR